MAILINIACAVVVVMIILYEIKSAKTRKAEKASLKANKRDIPQSVREKQ